MADSKTAQHILENDVPAKFPVPGAAVAIVKDGQLLAKHAWGYANLESRAPMTTEIVFPICSISKQMVCLVLTDLITERGPQFEKAVLDAIRELLPASILSDKNFDDLDLGHLVGMRSGLPDYWALTVLWGAAPQDRFSIYQDLPKALKRLGNFHFKPGTQMSYSNTNFAAVGLAIEKATGEPLADLLQTRLFQPAGMKTAVLGSDTARIPTPLVGYEGSATMGYMAYQNRIEWSGDAGVWASLEDMISYERFIDRQSTITTSAYSRNSQEPKYIDGSTAHYGQGLTHFEIDGVKVIGHTGALGGFRLRRIYAASERLSVVVLLNSEEVDIKECAAYVLKQFLASQDPAQSSNTNDTQRDETKKVSWTGYYLDDESKLAIAVKQDNPGEIKVNYGGDWETLKILSPNNAGGKDMQITFSPANSNIAITRPFENRHFSSRPLSPISRPTSNLQPHPITSRLLGTYHSASISSTFHVTGTGNMLYGSFDGFLGIGPVHLMRHLTENVWWLSCHRSLDAPAPGEWTVVFEESGDGTPSKATVGCWLARGSEFLRSS